MSFSQSIHFCPQSGLSYVDDPDFRQVLERLQPVADSLREEIAAGETSYLKLPSERGDITAVQDHVARLRRFCTDIVVLGVGGSSLGAQTLCSINHTEFNLQRAGPYVHFPDNLSPRSMELLIEGLDLGTAHFLIVSKSGNTVETLAQAALCLEAAQRSLVKTELQRHFTVIVGPGPSPLRRIAERFGFPTVDHAADLSGRYSVFSLVGMLPALVTGLSAQRFREGAQQTIKNFVNSETLLESPAAVGAATTQYLHDKFGVNMSVMMPYDRRLDNFSRWYQQLWSESLGKGPNCTTPVRALGPSDQHSLLQLFLDGPHDKFVSVVHENTKGRGPAIDASLAREFGFEFLGGRSVGDLVRAEARATIETLIAHGRPVREIEISELDEHTLGGLMMSMMLETVLNAGLLGVNPFDQPAVEDGKRVTIEFLEKYALE